jgi:hypothetical protein
MQINGAPYDSPTQRGHVLLLAGGTTGKRRHVHRPAANLAVLAAAQPSALLGGGVAADVVQLLDEADPQALLTRLRTAAATPGPLALYLSGQLTVDRRQHQLHLVLARTTALTVRYTAMPWWWLRHELRARSTADTAVFADLTADAAAWRTLVADPSLLAEKLPLYGVVTPPDMAGDGAATPYTRHLAELLRHSRNPRQPAELHQLSATHSSLGGTPLWYAPAPAPVADPPAEPRARVPAQVPAPAPPSARAAPPPAGDALPPVPAATVSVPVPAPVPAQPTAQPAPPPDPHQDIWRAVQAGRHTEAAAMAAAWEEHSLRTTGPDSEQSRHWLEIRADLARRAGDHVRATELCVAIAQARLRQPSPDARQVGTAVDNAHHCWERVADPVVARRLAPGLIALRRVVPGPGDRLLRAAEERLARLEQPEDEDEGGRPRGPDGVRPSSHATA